MKTLGFPFAEFVTIRRDKTTWFIQHRLTSKQMQVWKCLPKTKTNHYVRISQTLYQLIRDELLTVNRYYWCSADGEEGGGGAPKQFQLTHTANKGRSQHVWVRTQHKQETIESDPAVSDCYHSVIGNYVIRMFTYCLLHEFICIIFQVFPECLVFRQGKAFTQLITHLSPKGK